jgi:hypothetical protein
VCGMCFARGESQDVFAGWEEVDDMRSRGGKGRERKGKGNLWVGEAKPEDELAPCVHYPAAVLGRGLQEPHRQEAEEDAELKIRPADNGNHNRVSHYPKAPQVENRAALPDLNVRPVVFRLVVAYAVGARGSSGLEGSGEGGRHTGGTRALVYLEPPPLEAADYSRRPHDAAASGHRDWHESEGTIRYAEGREGKGWPPLRHRTSC